MKKISTAEGKQARNFEDRQLTIGLDLGDRSSWYCVLDETGEVLLEQKLSTTPNAMKEVPSRVRWRRKERALDRSGPLCKPSARKERGF